MALMYAPFASVLPFPLWRSPSESESMAISAFAGYPEPSISTSLAPGVSNTASTLHPLSSPFNGSGTNFANTLMDPSIDTRPNRTGSPGTARRARSIGSLGLSGLPQVPGVPAHTARPDSSKVTPRNDSPGPRCVTGQLTSVYVPCFGRPVAYILIRIMDPSREASLSESEVLGVLAAGPHA